jgi:hypothetical protein
VSALQNCSNPTPDTQLVCGTIGCIPLGPSLSGFITCDANKEFELYMELWSQPNCTGTLLSGVDADNATCIAANTYQISNSVFAQCSKSMSCHVVTIHLFCCHVIIDLVS